jgi:ankyrin repeat protein
MARIPEESLQDPDLFIALQDRLASLTDGDVPDLIEWLRETPYLSGKQSARIVVRALINLLRVRAEKIPLYARTAKSLSSEFPDLDFPQLVFNEVIHKVFSYHVCVVENALLFFLHRLIREDLLTPGILVTKIAKFQRTKSNYFKNLNQLVLYFAPEIEAHDPELFSMLLRKLDFHPDAFILPKAARMKMHYFDPRNWAGLLEDRDFTHCNDPYMRILIDDDVAALRLLSASPGFEVERPLDINPLCPYVALDCRPPLIGAAAFFGAAECFTFLMLCGARLDSTCDDGQTVAQLAVAGGNIEVVRQVQQARVNMAGCTQAAALFFRGDILEWLAGSDPGGVSAALYEAATSNNVAGARFCIGRGCDVMRRDAAGLPAIDRAAYFGGLETTRLLLASESVRGDFDGMSLALCHAATAGRADAVRLLLASNCVDPAVPSIDGLAVMRAIEQSHIGCARLILEDPRSAVTMADGHFGKGLFVEATRQYDPRMLRLCMDGVGPGAIARIEGACGLWNAVSINAFRVLQYLLVSEARAAGYGNIGGLTLLDMAVALGHEESVREIVKRPAFRISPEFRGRVSPQIAELLREQERAQQREDGDDAPGGMLGRQFGRRPTLGRRRAFGGFHDDCRDDYGPEPPDDEPPFDPRGGFARHRQSGGGFNRRSDGPDGPGGFGHSPFGSGGFGDDDDVRAFLVLQ